MTQPVPIKPKPKRALSWDTPPVKKSAGHFPHFKKPSWGKGWMRQAALGCALTLLCACYCGFLQGEATTVLAVHKELPIYCVEREDEVISVSFDASWGGDQTMKILDILDEYDAKATFFLVGIWVEKFPELVKAIADRGHEIGNHSATHPHMTQLSAEKMRQELHTMSDQLERITGERPTLFRPPYGDYNNQVVTVTREAGYEIVQWSVDSLDWKNRGVQDLIDRATKDVKKGDIILFHNDSQYIVDALPTILASYRKQGLQMIPVGDILLSGETTIDVQGCQHPKAQ